ncbi:MAG TPA: anthranilate synthase component I family protein, partial [Bdellovibrionota bacterium]|nr:anthranilate synthase component I family protein [Bdellovibrionota bacterium]
MKIPPYSFWLDSGPDGSSWYGSNPSIVIWMKDGVVRIASRNGDLTLPARERGGLGILEETWKKFADSLPQKDLPSNSAFSAGGVGFFGYDLGRHFEKLPQTTIDDLGFPDWCFAFYESIIPVPGGKIPQFSRMVDWSPPPLPISVKNAPQSFSLKSNMTKEEYLEGVRRIKGYLRSGDTYQVNFAQRFAVKTDRSPFEAYCQLRELNSVPFGAYLDYGNAQILSQSPELFLLKDPNGSLITEPIKGTRRRGETASRDMELKEELFNSSKDRAELTMIVDLERNDLGRVSVPGSVTVGPEIYRLKTFPTVHHLVSTIRGVARRREGLASIMAAMFPGGSITGAPKVRAM